MLPSLRMITMSSPYHRPVAAVSATHSHATQNTDASVTGGTGTGITGITDVALTQSPRFGGTPTAWLGPKASVLQRLLAVARSTGEITEITAGPTNVTATRLGVGRVS